MNSSYTIREWLQRAFTEQVDLINESYFYDRAENEFYSVFITDYFLTDADSTQDYPNSPYSKEELIVLCKRIDRQESHDPSITIIPRLTLEERKQMMTAFLENKYVQDQSIQNFIDTEDGRSNLNFNELLPLDMEEEWRHFKWDFVQEQIDTFCNINNINLESVSLWTDNKMTTMSLDVNDIPKETNPPSKQEEVVKKPWWRLW